MRLPVLLVLLLLVLGEQVVLGGPVVRLDRAVESALVPHRDNALVALARVLTELGDPTLVVPLLLVGVVLLPRRGAALRHVVVLVAVLAAAVLGLKAASVGRPRTAARRTGAAGRPATRPRPSSSGAPPPGCCVAPPPCCWPAGSSRPWSG